MCIRDRYRSTRRAKSGESFFVGHADDPFFVDLGGIFDLGDSPRQSGKNLDNLACKNVSAICIEIPISDVINWKASKTPASILDPNYVVGIWAVSYTHLDVYKRQHEDKPFLAKC